MACRLVDEPLGTKLSEISIKIHTFLFKKMHLEVSSAKWRPFCFDFNVLIQWLSKRDSHAVMYVDWRETYSDTLKLEMSSCWWTFHYRLHWKLSKWASDEKNKINKKRQNDIFRFSEWWTGNIFHPVWVRIMQDCGTGVGVTKTISSVPLYSDFFSIIKTHVSYWISRLYLTGVAAAQLRWHLSNMNVIQII